MSATTLPRTEDVCIEVRRLATQKPEHIYRNPEGIWCNNFRYDLNGNKVGDCIIGQAMMNLGYEFIDAEQGEPVSCFAFIGEGRLWLSEVQSRQDSQMAWGKCVYLADLAFPNVVNLV